MIRPANSSVHLKQIKIQEATALLRADHQAVHGLFIEFENTRSATRKKQIVAKICTELTVHAQVEEEIFYPAMQRALMDRTFAAEATVQRALLKELIGQVEGIEPNGEMYDAKIRVLREYVRHHVKEEQEQMFPKAKSSHLDLIKLGADIGRRKSELMAERAQSFFNAAKDLVLVAQ